MKKLWKVKLTNDPEDKSWVFKTKKEAELFIEDRYNLTNHLGYNPDDTYYLQPMENGNG